MNFLTAYKKIKPILLFNKDPKWATNKLSTMIKNVKTLKFNMYVTKFKRGLAKSIITGHTNCRLQKSSHVVLHSETFRFEQTSVPFYSFLRGHF